MKDITEDLELIEKRADAILNLIRTEYYTAIEVNAEQIKRAVARIKLTTKG